MKYLHHCLFFITLILFLVLILRPLISPFLAIFSYLTELFLCLLIILFSLRLLSFYKQQREFSHLNSLFIHRLNTLLTEIKWPLEMLLNNNFGTLSQEQKEVISQISEKNNEVNRLITSLPLLSSLEKLKISDQLSNLKEIVQSIIDSCRKEINKKKIALTFVSPSESLPPLKINPFWLELVIQILIDNAIKYTPPGGRIDILVSFDKNKKNIIFEIEDTGIGIKKEEQKKIFQKNFRGSNTFNFNPTGSGTGLYLAKKIIKKYRGEIWFKSEENQGTRFFIRFPL